MFREYFEEHPEEYQGIKDLLDRSEKIELERHIKRQDKLKLIEECRRKLNAERE